MGGQRPAVTSRRAVLATAVTLPIVSSGILAQQWRCAASSRDLALAGQERAVAELQRTVKDRDAVRDELTQTRQRIGEVEAARDTALAQERLAIQARDVALREKQLAEERERAARVALAEARKERDELDERVRTLWTEIDSLNRSRSELQAQHNAALNTISQREKEIKRLEEANREASLFGVASIGIGALGSLAAWVKRRT